MRKVFHLSIETGVPLLRFLWKWKLVSSAALSARFFSSMKNPFSAYNYLNRLRLAHYITPRAEEEGRAYLWSLDRAGFDAISHHLPVLREAGYKSECPRHDWLTSAFHLGDWLIRAPSGVESFSEQELRRFDPEHYPRWVPRSQSHRPDGYWHRSEKNVARTLALEMELNRKKASSYQSVGSFYGEATQVGRVLWVVPTLSDAIYIDAALAKAPGARKSIHSFVMLESFIERGWSAQIESGPGKGLSVDSFMNKALDLHQNAEVIPTRCHGITMALLETHLKRFKPAPYGHEEGARFSQLTTASAVATPLSHETRLIV